MPSQGTNTVWLPDVSLFIHTGWDKTVHDHLLALASNPVEILWPRDTLFKLDISNLAIIVATVRCYN